jgi:hypothetical protein
MHKNVGLFLALYPSWFLLSAVFSAQPRTALGPVLTAFYLAALGAAVAILTTDHQVRECFLRGWRTAGWICVSGVVLGLCSYALGLQDINSNPWLHIQGTIPSWLRPRIEGWFRSPNMMCDVMVYCLGVAFIIHRRGGSLRLPIALAISSLWTFSSGLGALAIVLAQQLGRTVLRWLLYLLALAILLINIVSYPALKEGQILPSHRAQAWMQAGQHILSSPFLGAGPGQADIQVRFLYPDGRPTYIAEAHSLPLSLLSQIGLPGALIFFGLVYAVAARSKAEDSPLLTALLASVLYHGLTGSWEDARHLWIVLGYLGANCEPVLPAKIVGAPPP